MNVTETISVVEVIWTVPSLVGLVFAIWMLIDVLVDEWSRDIAGWNGLAEVYSKSKVRLWFLLALVLVIFSMIGLFALTQPPTPGVTTTPGPVAVAITLLFIAVPALIAIIGIGERRDRRTIERLGQQTGGR